MPLYEYECAKCGERFEEIQKFSDPPVKKHPGCGGKVRKLLSAPAIQFKGTGWYITDYARAGKSDPNQKADNKAAKQEAKGGSASSSDSSSSGDSSSSSESGSSGKSGSPGKSKATSESSKTTTANASKK
jgi:putative FmdB family regulatory protein